MRASTPTAGSITTFPLNRAPTLSGSLCRHGGGRRVAVGGGTKGGLWTQMVSDVTGREQEIPGVTIGASYGDALLAAIAAGLAAPDA